jgi:hypothetical protein
MKQYGRKYLVTRKAICFVWRLLMFAKYVSRVAFGSQRDVMSFCALRTERDRKQRNSSSYYANLLNVTSARNA